MNRVMVVHKDFDTRFDIVRLLMQSQCMVASCASGGTAFNTLTDDPHFDLLFTEFDSGFLNAVHKRFPHIAIVVLGHSTLPGVTLGCVTQVNSIESYRPFLAHS